MANVNLEIKNIDYIKQLEKENYLLKKNLGILTDNAKEIILKYQIEIEKLQQRCAMLEIFARR